MLNADDDGAVHTKFITGRVAGRWRWVQLHTSARCAAGERWQTTAQSAVYACVSPFQLHVEAKLKMHSINSPERENISFCYAVADMVIIDLMQLVDSQSLLPVYGQNVLNQTNERNRLSIDGDSIDLQNQIIIDCRLGCGTAGGCVRRVRAQMHTNSDYLDFPNFNLFKTNVYLLMPNGWGWMDRWMERRMSHFYLIQFGIAMWTTIIYLVVWSLVAGSTTEMCEQCFSIEWCRGREQ